MRDATSFGLASSAFSWPWIRVCTDRSLSWFRLLSSSAGSMAAAAAAAAAAWRAALEEPAAQSLPVGSRSLAASARCQAVDGQRLGRQLRTGLRPRTSRLPPLGSVHDATKTSQQTTAGLQRRSSDWPTELQMRIHRFDSSRRRQAHRVVQPLPRRLRLRRLACVASCRHTTKEPAPEGGRCITRTTYWPFLTLPAGAPTLSSESPLAPWPQP